jgi:hypothetical protein
MRSATELDRKFNIVLGTAPAVERILEVTGLIPLLGVVSTVEQALAMTRDGSALVPSAPA